MKTEVVKEFEKHFQERSTFEQKILQHFQRRPMRGSLLTFNEGDSKFMPKMKMKPERSLNMSEVRRLKFAWMI